MWLQTLDDPHLQVAQRVLHGRVCQAADNVHVDEVPEALPGPRRDRRRERVAAHRPGLNLHKARSMLSKGQRHALNPILHVCGDVLLACVIGMHVSLAITYYWHWGFTADLITASLQVTSEKDPTSIWPNIRYLGLEYLEKNI